MQQVVQALRQNGASAAAADHQANESKVVTAIPTAAATVATTPWTGPPYGTFLSYALLQWVAFGYEQREKATVTEASTVLEHLSVRCDSGSYEGRDKDYISQFFLPHPILLVQEQPQQHEEKGSRCQRQHHQKQRASAAATVRRVHVLQQRVLRHEHLIHCRKVLRELQQLLQACRGTPHRQLLSFAPPSSSGINKSRQGFPAALSQTVRLIAFLLGTENRIPLCGVWIRGDMPANDHPLNNAKLPFGV